MVWVEIWFCSGHDSMPLERKDQNKNAQPLWKNIIWVEGFGAWIYNFSTSKMWLAVGSSVWSALDVQLWTPGQMIPESRADSDFRGHEVIKGWVVWDSGYWVQGLWFWIFAWAKLQWRDGKWEDYFNKDPCKETDKWINQSRNRLRIRCESSSEKQD